MFISYNSKFYIDETFKIWTLFRCLLSLYLWLQSCTPGTIFICLCYFWEVTKKKHIFQVFIKLVKKVYTCVFLNCCLLKNCNYSNTCVIETKWKIKIFKTVFLGSLRNLTKFEYFLHLLWENHEPCPSSTLKKFTQKKCNGMSYVSLKVSLYTFLL